MAVLASALAAREGGSFAWADGLAGADPPDLAAHRVLEASSGTVEDGAIRPEELLPPASGAESVAHWLLQDPLAADAGSRLDSYLKLPSLLQRLISRSTAPSGRAVVVLTNLDGLPGWAVDRAFGAPEVHATLRREGVFLVVTVRGQPSDAIRARFDRIYRIDAGAEEAWPDARVTSERGGADDGLPPGRRLGERLPWLGLSGTPLKGSIAGHRLR